MRRIKELLARLVEELRRNEFKISVNTDDYLYDCVVSGVILARYMKDNQYERSQCMYPTVT